MEESVKRIELGVCYWSSDIIYPKLEMAFISLSKATLLLVYNQSSIVFLRWIVEMGRVDICLETSVMSSRLALPQEYHLRKSFQIFCYLKTHTNTELAFDPHLPNWWNSREEMFPKRDWKGTPYYKGSDGRLNDSIPENTPKPLGQGIVMSAWVDSDHDGDKVTRCLRTGFLVYLQSSLVSWFS